MVTAVLSGSSILRTVYSPSYALHEIGRKKERWQRRSKCEKRKRSGTVLAMGGVVARLEAKLIIYSHVNVGSIGEWNLLDSGPLKIENYAMHMKHKNGAEAAPKVIIIR
jgi:hypothetical protein